MRIFNADGSEAEMCGNGIRCLARFLADSDGEAPGRRWAIETPAGLIRPELQSDGQLLVDMGPPFWSRRRFPPRCRWSMAWPVAKLSWPMRALR